MTTFVISHFESIDTAFYHQTWQQVQSQLRFHLGPNTTFHTCSKLNLMIEVEHRLKVALSAFFKFRWVEKKSSIGDLSLIKSIKL